VRGNKTRQGTTTAVEAAAGVLIKSTLCEQLFNYKSMSSPELIVLDDI